MNISENMLNARENILKQGIQQTNRYRMFYPRLGSPYVYSDLGTRSEMGLYLYPYSVVLPGYGFDLIDHSMWSIIRKIPFRKTYSELQVTFIVGTSNYKSFVKIWDSIITKPARSNDGSVSDTWSYATKNGVSPSVFEEQEGSGTGFLTSDSGTGDKTVTGLGGGVNYMNKIHEDFVTISLLDEQKNPTTEFTFHESFISQIAPVQLTSTETGYSTFQVNFKFARVSYK